MKNGNGNMTATLRDVAKLAGVSVSTASFSLNGGDKVKEETRRRIAWAAEELNYIPNASARSLVTQKNLVIGVVRCVDKLDDRFYAFDTTIDTYLSEMLKSIEQESIRLGYSLMVEWSSTYGQSDGVPRLYKSGKVDGVLMVGGIVPREFPEKIKKLNVPTVMVGSRNDLFDWVDTDYTQAMREAVAYLVSLGHKDIAFINGPGNSQTSALKLEGFRQGLGQAGLPFDEKHVGAGDFSGLTGYEAMARFWENGFHPTALVAAVDCIAIGALRFLHERNVYCPDGISIVGFEDGLLAEYSVPPLTTFSSEKQLLGIDACHLLIQRIQHPEQPLEQKLIEPRLIVRMSTKTV